jgi:cephalosporin hydroxylase
MRLRSAPAKVRDVVRHRAHRATRTAVHRSFFRDLIQKTDNFGHLTWLGQPIWQNVLDLWVLQEAIAEIKPAVLLETGTNRGGSALFYAHLFDLIGKGRVVTVDVEKMHDLEHPRIDFLIGSSVGDEVSIAMREAAAEADGPVMVVLDSDHSEGHVTAELEVYAPLVTQGSLILVQDGVVDTLPAFAWGRPGPLPAIEKFLARNRSFYVDPRLDQRFLISHHPSGWLRRR